MHAFFSISMACLLFLQTVSGWCWQHPRECMPCATRSAEIAQPIQCCSHGCGDEEKQKPDAPGKCDLECHGVCTYLLPEKTQIDSSTELVSWDVIAVAMTASTDFARVFTSHWEHAFEPGGVEPPLPLYLTHQALLI